MSGLTASEVSKILKERRAGRFYDRDGLHLYVKNGGNSYWVVRWQRDGVKSEKSLGTAKSLTLKEAREAAKSAAAPVSLNPMTLTELAEAHFKVIEPGFRNERAAAGWLSSLKLHVLSKIGDRPVAALSEADIVDVLAPLAARPETLRRVRSRLRAVLRAAKGRGLRSFDLEAISDALPRPSSRVPRHFPAMPFTALPAFYSAVDNSTAGPDVRAALRFLMLTAARPGMVIGATVAELDGDVWKLPAERMKSARPFSVPLSPPAAALVKPRLERGGVLFRGRDGLEMSAEAMRMAMRRMGVDDAVPHGFRSAFKDWSLENGYADWLSELALAHVDGDRVRAAYARTEAFDMRRKMMEAWAEFLLGG